MESMKDRAPSEFSLEYHGIDYPSYWQGAGVSFTKWDNCFVGVGDTPFEAGEDALENAAQCGYDVDEIENDLENEPSAIEDSGLTESEIEDADELPQCYAVLYVKE